MPTIFEPKDLPITEKHGVGVATLANQTMLGTDALQVERITLSAGAESSTYKAVAFERFVYVVRGKGQAYINEQIFPLKTESVLWLEKGDTFYLEASSDEFEVLLCQAPMSG